MRQTGKQTIGELHAKVLVEVVHDAHQERDHRRGDGRNDRHELAPLGGVLVITAEGRDAEDYHHGDDADQRDLGVDLVHVLRDLSQDAEEPFGMELHPHQEGDLLHDDLQPDGGQHPVNHGSREDHEGTSQFKLGQHHLDHPYHHDTAEEDRVAHSHVVMTEGRNAGVECRGQARGARTDRHIATAQEGYEQPGDDARQHAGDRRRTARESDSQIEGN